MASGSDKDTYKVTMEDINKVTKELGPDELRHLYDNLGIPPHKVGHAEASAGTTDTILKAREVLRWWRQEKGSGFTQEALFGERDKILKSRTAKTEPDTGEFNLKQCQEQLRELYLGPQYQVQLTPWLGDDTREMEAIFVNLEMENEHSQVKHKQLESNEELVDLHYTDTGFRVNRILIQGDAGSGKSTLLNNLAYKWAKLQGTDFVQSSDSPLLQYDLVFLISINEIDDEHKNDSLEEIIFVQLLKKDSNVSKSSLKSYLELESNSKRCLFLVDAIDEDSVLLNSTKSEMSKLIYHNKIHRNSCVIASTRPDTLKNMGRSIKLNVFKKVHLIGFSDENIQEYIRKHFGTNDIVQYECLLRQLKERHDVWDLAGKPLLLMFFCVLWDDPDQANRSLPNTRTKLYQETITSLWKRYLYEHDLSDEGDLKSLLETLGKITLEGLLDPKEEKLLFKNSEFNETTLSIALGVGILSRKNIKSKLHMTSHVKFLHTSIQDYCSGVYLANLYITSNVTFKQCIKKMYLWNFTFYVHWFYRIFDAITICVGCKPETSRLLTTQYYAAAESVRCAEQGMSQERTEYKCLSKESLCLKKYISSLLYPNHKYGTHGLSITFPLMISYEAQLTYEECDSLVDIAVRQSDIQGIPLHFGFQPPHASSAEVKYMQYQLNLLKSVSGTNNNPFFSIITSIQVLDPIEFPKLYPSIVSMLTYTKQLSLLILRFKFVFASKQLNQVFDFSEMFDALADLKSCKELILHRCDDSSHHLDISQSLKKVTHLSKLVLICLSSGTATYMPHPFGPDVSLIKVVSQMKNLSQLCLAFFIAGRAVKFLKPIILQLNSLLIYPMNDGWSIYEFISYLQKAKVLNELNLYGKFHKTSICSLSDQLKHMVNLKELTLANTDLRDPEVKILVDGIKTMVTLHKLDLRGNPDIGLVGHLELQRLRLLPQFQELEIKLDPISSEMSQRQKVIDFLDSLPALPDCQRCMSQLYHSIKCKCRLCSRGDRGENEVVASSIPTSSKQKEPITKKWKQKFSSSADETTGDDNGQSAKRESAANIALNKSKTAPSESSGLPVQICVQEQVSPELPEQQPLNQCSNLECSKFDSEVHGGLKRCSRCKTVSYCSRDCQRKHWKIHRMTCGKNSSRKQSLPPELSVKKAEKL